MGGYNAASWLVDRHVDCGDGGLVAFRHQGSDMTYDALLHEVWRGQHALAEMGVRPGERVALVLDDEPAFPALFLAAMRSGAIPVPLSTMLTASEVSAIVADAGAVAVAVSGRYAGHLSALASCDTLRSAVVTTAPAPGAAPEATGLAVAEWASMTDRSEADVAATEESSPAFWLYSSGTTGTPKGVMHRHASLQATAATYARHVLRISREDRCLSVAKMFFAFGLGNSLTFPLAVGGCAVLNPERPTPQGVLDLVRTEAPTLFFASPGFVAALLDTDAPADTFASVRATVTAGEALPADLQRRFAERFGHPVLDGLGSTEALHIFLSNVAGAERPGTSGVPVPGYELTLLDETGTEVTEPDTPGQLYLRGPSLTEGYWQREEATRAAFRDGWMRTGDVYTRSSDGYWTFLGRNNDMIKAGGIWVSPAEVESVLIEHPDVLEAAVIGARDGNGLELTMAFVVPRRDHVIDEAAIETHCRARMAAFKRPRRIVVVDSLPKTATGKVQRFALRERASAAT